MFAFPEPVTIKSPGSVTDPYSDETVSAWTLPEGASWTAVPSERVESCAVAPGGSTEPTLVARNAIDSDFDLIFDHDPGVSPADRVVVRGLECEVDGRPFVFRSPFTGWEPGTLVRATVREG